MRLPRFDLAPGVRPRARAAVALVVLSGLVLAAASGFSACDGKGRGGGTGGQGGTVEGDGAVSLSRSELLAAFGTCAANEAARFRQRAAALETATANWVTAADAPALAGARQAFAEAMDSWQVLEVMQFGPTAPSDVRGGQDFRDQIYPWPLGGRCAVEEVVVSRAYEAADLEAALLVNRRGLGAIEYLLFYEGADTECAPSSSAFAAWAELAAEERGARKRAYAAAVARQISARAARLDDAWDPAKMNFVQTMRSAGSNAVYPTAKTAIETVGIALFYVDTKVKDRKVGMPLDEGCATASCLESRFAGRSKANIRANLVGLRRVLEGCEEGFAGLGFDDLLSDLGQAGQLATLHAALIAAEGALAAIEQPDLDQALAQDRASVMALRDAIAAVTTLLKTDFVGVLGFEPSIIPTDNDT
jgi:uncharacterized protein